MFVDLQAKYFAPSVIFIDEVDAIGGKSDSDYCRKLKSQIQTHMDGIDSGSENQVRSLLRVKIY